MNGQPVPATEDNEKDIDSGEFKDEPDNADEPDNGEGPEEENPKEDPDDEGSKL